MPDVVGAAVVNLDRGGLRDDLILKTASQYRGLTLWYITYYSLLHYARKKSLLPGIDLPIVHILSRGGFYGYRGGAFIKRSNFGR